MSLWHKRAGVSIEQHHEPPSEYFPQPARATFLLEIKDEDQCEDTRGTMEGVEGVEGVSPGVFILVEHQAVTSPHLSRHQPYVGCQLGEGCGQIITILGWD